MVRNLCIWNGRPSSPARVWLKNTGPRLSSWIAIAINGKSGAVNRSPTEETTMSKARLIIAVERDGSQVSYSSTGRSATRERRTGPARPCSGEITLSFTWRSRQSATRPADLARLHPVGGEDHPVDAAGERVEGLDLVLVDEAQVHVGEQVELAADHLREVALAEHRGDLGRRQPAPDPARRAAQHQGADGGDHPGDHGRARG